MHDSNSCSLVVVTQLNLIGVNLSKKNFIWLELQSEKEKKERKKNESSRGNILIPIFMVSQSVKP